MTFRSALAKLEARSEGRIELGLGRVRAHLSRLGDPQDEVPCFHVAGTNGKGAACAMLASVLRAAGYRTGLYISPHLLSVRERVSVDGRLISEADFARLLERAFAVDQESKLTYFELLTSVAFQYFRERNCDVTVLETGLGGRLDATNVVSNPLAALVTSIDYDHQAFLGNTLSRIATEKAGIYKRGRPALAAAVAPAALKALRRAAPDLAVVARPWAVEKTDWNRGVQILRAAPRRRYSLSLLGSRQGRNAALVRAAVESTDLDVPEIAWRRGLSVVRWPGRFEVIRLGRKRLIVDGAHNPEAARALAATWSSSPWSRRPARWILGVLRDKDAAGVVKPLAAHLRDVVLVRPPSPRAADPLELSRTVRRAAPQARITLERDTAAAIAAWKGDAKAPNVAVCAGSLYLAGAALKTVRRNA